MDWLQTRPMKINLMTARRMRTSPLSSLWSSAVSPSTTSRETTRLVLPWKRQGPAQATPRASQTRTHPALMTMKTMTISNSLRSLWDPTILTQENRTILWPSSRKLLRLQQSFPCVASSRLTSRRSWTRQWPACQATAGTSGSPLRRPQTRQTPLVQSMWRVKETSTRWKLPGSSLMINIFLRRDPSSTTRPLGTLPSTAAQRSHLWHATRTRSVRWALLRRPSKSPRLRQSAQTLTVSTGSLEITVTWTTPATL